MDKFKDFITEKKAKFEYKKLSKTNWNVLVDGKNVGSISAIADDDRYEYHFNSHRDIKPAYEDWYMKFTALTDAIEKHFSKNPITEAKEQYWIVNKFSGKVIQGSYNSEKTAKKIYKNGDFSKEEILVKSSSKERSTTSGIFLGQYTVVLNNKSISEAVKMTYKGKTNKEDDEKILKFVRSYDFYFNHIDDYKKLQKVQANNKWIVEELKKLGVTEFTVADQTKEVK